MPLMLEHFHDRTEASYLVTELATRIIEEESDVISKLRYIRRTVAYAKDAVAVEDAEQLRLLMLAPEACKYFKGPSSVSTMDLISPCQRRTRRAISQPSRPTSQQVDSYLLTHFSSSLWRSCSV